MKWIKSDEERLQVHLSRLMSHVKLPLLPPMYLQYPVCSETLLKHNMTCRDYLDEAQHYQLSLAQVFPEVQLSERMRPRKSYAG